MIYIFAKKIESLKTFFPKNAEFVSTPLANHSPGRADLTYVDISGLSEAELKKTMVQLKKSCKDSQWGIIDPKGSVKDSSALFFEGASDYLGASVLKTQGGLNARRYKEALQWRTALISSTLQNNSDVSVSDNGTQSESKTEDFIKSGVKLPAVSAFPGWKKIQTGKSMPFYLFYCALQGKVPLDSRLEGKALTQVHKKFVNLLTGRLKEADALLWMDTGKDCLFLVPPKVKCAELLIKACLGMIASSPLLVLETLNINVPANFIFALHYGSISYTPPGKTGTVVSDAVNSVFHLGAKKAEPGRLTVSGALPDASIPKSCYDVFASCGEYEGRKIWQTKKFKYEKNWY
jgi:hypothetical protein